MTKKYIQLDAEGICFHELEYAGQKPPRTGPELMDVTSRTDGPWLGKIYDRAADAFAWPEPTAKLTASASSISQGGKVTLSWETKHALSAEIALASGTVIHRCEPVHGGAVEVEPGQTYTYTLTATGRAGTTPATARRRVTVT
ncbi:MAG: hypothetical protein OXB98_02515 [Bryobacterales bacterium]|nr:hypothetical protein [Bryobacterales bacterium]